MKRVLTAVAMAAVMIPILIWGHHYYIFDAFGFILVLAAAWEFRRMIGKVRPQPRGIDVAAVVLAGGFYLAIRFAGETSGRTLLAGLLAIFVLGGLFLVYAEGFKSEDFGNLLTSTVYCSVGFAALAILRAGSIHWVVYVLLTSMATDTFAYLVGTRYGKHRLCPTVSPKKSVEGAVAGSLLGTAAAVAYALLVGVFPVDFHVVTVILVTFTLTAIAQLGDLVASKFKRNHDIKDYSNLFPGHGGVLDRFDSSMFAAAFLLLILLLATDLFRLATV